MTEKRLDVIAGATSGAIKGISIGATKTETKVRNLQSITRLDESDWVTRIAWGDDDEREILVACGAKKSNERRVKIFDWDSTILTDSFPCNTGNGTVTGISRYGKYILTSVESGEVCTWFAGKGEVLLNAGCNLNRMCHSRDQRNTIATGGDLENKLKMYDLETQKEIFQAKNLPNDWLNLRTSVSIVDLCFLPGGHQLVTVGKYGQIFLYDRRRQRRPVINLTVKDEAWTCVAVAPKENHVIAGSTKGKLNLVDLRKSGTVLNTYKGFTGGVTGVACSIKPYVASVSLDRYLRIHDIDTKKLLKSIYLTSKLSCLIMRSDVTLEMKSEDDTEDIYS